jgi:hypothetical protein
MVLGRDSSAVWPRRPNGIVAARPSNLLQGVVVEVQPSEFTKMSPSVYLPAVDSKIPFR